MTMNGFFTEEELDKMGFAYVGVGVKLSRLASFYGKSGISVGDYSRIDDFCVLSAGEGGIDIGRHVHVSVMCSLIGGGKIELADFSGISSRVSIFSSSDDFSGYFMTGPTLPSDFTNVCVSSVSVGRHVVIGTGCTILPGANIKEGAAVGAMSLVKGELKEFTMYFGIPAKEIKPRMRNILELEREFKDYTKRDNPL
jgi:acetyltransferase-like isoleucine patch superfamily enzyme